MADETPLREPVLVAAFEGWNDAASAASDAVRFLLRTFDATEIHELDTESYFDFQAARPHVEIVNGVTRTLRWPATKVYTARVAGSSHDLVLALGIEPNLHWPAFCREIVELARSLGAGMAVTLGALLGDTPHTRPMTITGTASDPQTAERLGLLRSRYQGPTGIVGVLADVARQGTLTSVSLWAPVPHYVASPPNPKATLALLGRLAELLELQLDLRSIDAAAQGWQQQVDAVTRSDDGLSEYVRGLEQRFDGAVDLEDAADIDDDAVLFDDDLDDWDDDDDDDDDEGGGWDGGPDAPDLPTGETLAADFERYLREQRPDDEAS